MSWGRARHRGRPRSARFARGAVDQYHLVNNFFITTTITPSNIIFKTFFSLFRYWTMRQLKCTEPSHKSQVDSLLFKHLHGRKLHNTWYCHFLFSYWLGLSLHRCWSGAKPIGCFSTMIIASSVKVAAFQELCSMTCCDLVRKFPQLEETLQEKLSGTSGAETPYWNDKWGANERGRVTQSQRW